MSDICFDSQIHFLLYKNKKIKDKNKKINAQNVRKRSKYECKCCN